MRQGRDLAVNEALLRVRRLLRRDAKGVAAALDAAGGGDDGLPALQWLELLRQQELLPGGSVQAAALVLLLAWCDSQLPMRPSMLTAGVGCCVPCCPMYLHPRPHGQ